MRAPTSLRMWWVQADRLTESLWLRGLLASLASVLAVGILRLRATGRFALRRAPLRMTFSLFSSRVSRLIRVDRFFFLTHDGLGIRSPIGLPAQLQATLSSTACIRKAGR